MMLRALPEANPVWERDADVVVVGSGAAGMTAVLTAAGHGRRVLLICKDDLGGGSTPLAQGGMAAALDPGDSAALHARDTLEAGAGRCDPAAVEVLVSRAPSVIGWLGSLGARLEREPLHLEGGHSRRRIVHAGGDAVGAEVHRTLRAALLASSAEIVPHAVALDLVPGGLLLGLVRPGERALHVGVITTRAVVLATGGFGRAFATTTNPAGITGDGLALAARAGAVLRDVEFVQFHPTVLWSAGASGQCPLITEALRGSGATLLDALGEPVMAGLHELGDLAPRDVVSAAMHDRIESGGGIEGHLWLDARMLSRPTLQNDFPTVTAACQKRGIDPATDLIPVAPGAHYACGGIRADMTGRTSRPGLYAIGEAASTGVHGANRLASNSLTEAMIQGRRLGDLLGRDLPPPAGAGRAAEAGGDMEPGFDVHLTTSKPGSTTTASAVAAASVGVGVGVSPSARAALAEAMSRHAGVMRDEDGLTQLLHLLHQAPTSSELDLATVEATNLHTVSALVATAALNRKESRGCHRRRDTALARGIQR